MMIESMAELYAETRNSVPATTTGLPVNSNSARRYGGPPEALLGRRSLACRFRGRPKAAALLFGCAEGWSPAIPGLLEPPRSARLAHQFVGGVRRL